MTANEYVTTFGLIEGFEIGVSGDKSPNFVNILKSTELY